MSEKNIGSVVIVGDDMQVMGIVTERDLMRRLLNKSLDPKTTQLSTIMTSEIRTGRADDEVINSAPPNVERALSSLASRSMSRAAVNIMSQGDFVSFTWPDLLGLLKEKTRDSFKEARRSALDCGNDGLCSVGLADRQIGLKEII